MTTYSFRIDFNVTPGTAACGAGGELSNEAIDILYAPGCCDDAVFGTCEGQNYAAFDRDATGPGVALASALMALRVVKGIEVTDINFEKE